MVLRVASAAASCVSSVAPLQRSFPHLPSLHVPSPVELSESRSEADGDDDVVGLTHKLDSMEDSGVYDPEEEEDLEEGEEEEEEDMDNFIDTSGLEPNTKNNICGWKELQDQIKSDMDEGHKQHDTCIHMNKLLILRNFATLHIKGI